MAVNETAGYGLFERTAEQIDKEILYSVAERYLRKGGVVRAGQGVLTAGQVMAFDATVGKWVKYTDVASTNEVQTIDVTATVSGGSFKLTFNGVQTGALAWNISNADLKTALEALSPLSEISPPGLVTISNGPMPADTTITFGGGLAAEDVPALVIDGSLLTGGGSAAIVTTTPGVQGGPVAAGILARGIDTGTNNQADADQHVDIYRSGTFKTAALVGLDANAITDLGAHQDTVYGWTRIR